MPDAKAKQIFLWFGPNDFEIHEKISQWRALFEKKYSGLNLLLFDLTEAGAREKIATELKNALQVNSLFGSNKLILLKDFLPANAKLPDEVKELLTAELKRLSPGYFVVFYQNEKPDERGVICKTIRALQKQGKAEAQEFILLAPGDLPRWVANRAKKHGANFSPEAVHALVALAGADLWQIDCEVRKLAHFKNGAVIGVADVNEMVKGKYNEDIFQLMDAISAQDKKKALKLFRDQLATGAEDMYLLTMLVRQFRIFWQILEAGKGGGVGSDALARELGLHPYVVKKSLQYARNFSLPQVKKIYRRLLDCEVGIKMKNINFELLFDLLVAEM